VRNAVRFERAVARLLHNFSIVPDPITEHRSTSRYELCSRPSRIGCVLFLLILLSMTGAMSWMAPRAALSLLICLPFAPIGVAVLVSMVKSVGQVLETDGKVATLTKNGATVWRFSWANIKLLRVNGSISWDLEDGDGRSYRLIVMNLPKTKSDEVAAFLPFEATTMDARFDLIRRRSEGPSYPLAIVLLAGGLAALMWGVVGIILTSRAVREGDAPIDLSRLGWQMTGFVAGVLAVCAGVIEIRRKPPTPRPLVSRPNTLRKYLTGSSGLKLPPGESVWEVIPGCENSHRNEGRVLLFAVIFWSFMLSLVIEEVVHNPRGWGLLVIYAPIVLMHVVGVIAWVKEVGPKGYTIHLLESDGWVESESGTYPAKVGKWMGSPAIEFSLDGKRRLLDPKHFTLREL